MLDCKSDLRIARRAKDKFWYYHPIDDLYLTNIYIHSTEQTVSHKHIYSSLLLTSSLISCKDSFTTDKVTHLCNHIREKH